MPATKQQDRSSILNGVKLSDFIHESAAAVVEVMTRHVLDF